MGLGCGKQNSLNAWEGGSGAGYPGTLYTGHYRSGDFSGPQNDGAATGSRACETGGGPVGPNAAGHCGFPIMAGGYGRGIQTLASGLRHFLLFWIGSRGPILDCFLGAGGISQE